ncbi:2-amino-4-hydroxy-6-hydroxymethyldihydropteridine diphosphokinase [Pseudoxanthomonas sp. Root630]|uniref:2-amino-4-hydroxy-6- hydroxymethyldihydropteridine diphosphokinase n=1 Tax=Pseudoxanthomonas sp. Root630 TaxID=1736574 RepID=UPI0007027FBB|nr:2-amino-4-hydroxy-6-hydroxymethyldihydropteridine diphosphokinase [Pseudoxanthomonas sp. Root630]KRA42366.1 2-amino-4-hydroxy-6-hydroxymethyldihydropteridine pyrophosphokinase [Pseudoxanthomonas sp. Root630]
MTPHVRACIGLGANLGDAADTLRRAFDALGGCEGVEVLRTSRLYRTPAWGREDQPDFINAVALVDTTLAPRALLERLLAVEAAFGRQRAEGERWGPRTLDLDLLLYGDVVVDEPGLHVPHPHLHERAFALIPLLEVLPNARIPGYGDARDAVSGLEMSNIHPL